MSELNETETIKRLAREASQEAVAELIANGKPVTIGEDGYVTTKHPDGRVEKGKKLPDPIRPKKLVYHLKEDE